MAELKNRFLDRYGQPIMTSRPLKKQAFAQFSSIYEFPNAGRFRPRIYTNQDSELGVNQYSRDLLLRWSREMCGQQPWIYAGIKVLSTFAVGKEYCPCYYGKNTQWGEIATQWLKEVFYPNACLRGPNYDLQTVFTLLSEMVDQDGDILLVFGEEDGLPKFQMVPAHRIRTLGTSPFDFVYNENTPKVGPVPGTVVSDGVVYDLQGRPVGYSVQNANNMVNSSFSDSNGLSTFISARNSRLVYAPRFPDRGRGIPTISSGILQALSVEEIEAYMTEKLKIQSMYAVVEKVPEGEGPLEEEEAYRRSVIQNTALNGFTIAGNAGDTATQGLRIVNNPAIKYVSCAGGDIKFPAASITEKETSDYITRLETHVLGCLGVPHVLIFSQDDVAGKMNESVIKMFNGAIEKRQQLLDFHGKFILGWALAKAIKNKDLPPNDEEILTNCFEFTHPEKFSLNDSKINQDNLSYYSAGAKSLNEVCKTRNTTAKKVLDEIETETIDFFESAKRIADKTGQDISIVLQKMDNDMKQKTAPFGGGSSLPQ